MHQKSKQETWPPTEQKQHHWLLTCGRHHEHMAWLISVASLHAPIKSIDQWSLPTQQWQPFSLGSCLLLTMPNITVCFHSAVPDTHAQTSLTNKLTHLPLADRPNGLDVQHKTWMLPNECQHGALLPCPTTKLRLFFYHFANSSKFKECICNCELYKTAKTRLWWLTDHGDTTRQRQEHSFSEKYHLSPLWFPNHQFFSVLQVLVTLFIKL